MYKEVTSEKIEIWKILEDVFLDMYSHMLKLNFEKAAEIFFENYFPRFGNIAENWLKNEKEWIVLSLDFDT